MVTKEDTEDLIISVEVAVRHSAEDPDNDERDDSGTEDRLNENGVLDLTQGRLLDPDLSVEDLADYIALLVLSDPWLILVTVAGSMGCETVERVALQIDACSRLVIGSEQFPRTEMAMMHTVQDDAHSLPSRDQR